MCSSFSGWVLSFDCDLYTCGVWVDSIDPVADLLICKTGAGQQDFSQSKNHRV